MVGPIRDDWVIGVAGGEIPWLGTVKLMVGGPNAYGTRDVPPMSFIGLFAVIGGVVFAPVATESMFPMVPASLARDEGPPRGR